MRLRVGERVLGMVVAEEGVHFSFDAGQPQIVISIPRPQKDEIAGLNKGALQMRLISNPMILFLLFCFQGPRGHGIPWSDARFEWHRMDPVLRHLPTVDEQPSWLFLLVDSSTQVLFAARMLRPDEAFQRAFNEAVRDQAQSLPPAQHEVDALVRGMEAYSSTELAALAEGFQRDGVTGKTSVLATQRVLSMRSYEHDKD